MSEFILGNCMNYLKDYPDNYYGLAIVDPPYGGVTLGGYAKNKMTGGLAKHPKYNLSLWDQNRPDRNYFTEIKRVSKNQIIWGGNYFIDYLEPSQCWIVWDKIKDFNGCDFADVELAFTSFNKASRIFRFQWSGMLQGDMKNKEKRIHPTQKPVRLYTWILDNFAQKGDKILDTHVGSASSLIACERMGYEYVGYEINEEYYKMASARLDEERAQAKWQF